MGFNDKKHFQNIIFTMIFVFLKDRNLNSKNCHNTKLHANMKLE